MPQVFETEDPYGVRVVLEAETWERHIIPRHGEMKDGADAIAATIQNPNLIHKQANSLLYSKLGGWDRYPDLYVLVVVKESLEDGGYRRVRTARLQRTIPSKGELVWMQLN